MSRVVVRWIADDGTLQVTDIEGLERALAAPFCWVDVTDPDQTTLEALAAPLGLHPLAVEDSLHHQRRPKLDLYPEGPFFTWLTPHLSDEDNLTNEELDVFLYERFLVTTHDGVIEEIDEVASDAAALLPRGTDWILHGILDRLVDSVVPIADAIGDRLEDVEDRMLAQPTKHDLEELYELRRSLLSLHKIISPQRDMIRTLSRERSFVSEEAFRYFDDIVDHLLHVEESLETYRDIGSAVMDIFLTAQSNRLNEVMKVLTVVTVLIGAMTLVSGIYGMNLLEGMWPPPNAPWSFGAVMALMAAIGAVMALIFRRMKWW